VRLVVGWVDWEAVELSVWGSRYGQSRIELVTKLYREPGAHTLCSFCNMFSNTRGHSDLSSCVRETRVIYSLRDLHVDGAVASCVL